MALVFGSEPSTFSHFAIQRRATTATTKQTMASLTKQRGKSSTQGSSQSTASVPSSSSPIPIVNRGAEAKGAVPTPPNSLETIPKIPDSIRGPGKHKFGAALPPTPGDLSPENARHRSGLDLHVDPSQRILDRLLKIEREGKNPLDQLDMNDIM